MLAGRYQNSFLDKFVTFYNYVSYAIPTFVLIMSAFYWVGAARLIRSKALAESQKDYILASKD